MTRFSTLAALALLASVSLPTLASAQAETGTGGGPTSTVTAPHTSTLGRTMPPSSGAGAATADDRQERTPQQTQDDKISRGICIGCGPK